MDTLEFLNTILSSEGQYYVGFHDSAHGMRQVRLKSIAEVADVIERGKSKKCNIFVGTASFEPDTTKRSQECVLHKQAFYLDLDCGPSKTYSTQQDAAHAAVTFVNATGFPRPTLMLSSGHGVHLYWILDEPLIGKAWGEVARRFKDYVRAQGFVSDPAVTADSARFMRVPGTMNYKDAANPTECKVIKNYGGTVTIEQFGGALPGTPASNVVSMFGTANGFDSMMQTGGDKPRYFKEIINSCGVAKHHHETGGKDADYHEWFSMLNLLAFCEDGKDYYHHVSFDHPSYDEATVDAKWREALIAKDVGKLAGATTCKTFRDSCEGICSACPHFTEEGSPIKFGSPTHNPDELPWGYHYVKPCGMGRQDGDEVKRILDYKVEDFRALVDEDGTQYMQFVLQAGGPMNKRTKCKMPLDEAKDKRLFSSNVAGAGVIMHDKQFNELRGLTTNWFQKIEREKGTLPAVKNYGWVELDDEHAFVLGETVHQADGSSFTTVPPDKQVAQMYTPKGSEEKWRSLANDALRAEHIETEIIFASAFAAPLVHFTGVPSCIISAISSKSGTGKTLAMRLAQSVWGDPVRGINSMNDTYNALGKRLGIGKNLPAYWDEVRVTSKQGQAFVDFLFQCSQGREKQRMRADTTIHEQMEWCTMLTCASNTSIQERIAQVDTSTIAGTLRVLEFSVDPLDESKTANVMGYNKLNEHYGHIGPQFAAYLATHRAEVGNKVEGYVNQMQTRLGMKPEERFLFSAIAAIVAGASLATQLGYVTFDAKAITARLLKELVNTRKLVESESNQIVGQRSSMNQLSRFLTDRAEHILYTNRCAAGRGGAVEILNKPKKLPITARIGRDDKEIRIDTNQLKQWCEENECSHRAIEIDMFTRFNCYTTRPRLAGGVAGMGSPQVTALTIPLTADTARLFPEAGDVSEEALGSFDDMDAGESGSPDDTAGV